MSLRFNTGAMQYRESPSDSWQPLVIKANMNWESMAETYDPVSGSYEYGEYVLHNGEMFRCISTTGASGTWDSTKWTSVSVGDELASFIIISDTQPTETSNKIWIKDTASQDPVQVPTMTEFSALESDVVDISDDVDAIENTLNSEIATRQTYVRPNLLDNWYFVYGKTIDNSHPYSSIDTFPINQRGQRTYNGSWYGIDRWVYGEQTINSDSVDVLTSAMYQRFPFNDDLYNSVTTISVLTKSGLYSASGVISEGAYSTGDYGVSAGYDSSIGNIWVGIYGVEAIAAKFELGSGQTLAHNEGTESNPVWVLNEVPDYGEQMLRCCSSTAESSDTYANKPYNELINTDTSIEGAMAVVAVGDTNTTGGLLAYGTYIYLKNNSNLPEGLYYVSNINGIASNASYYGNVSPTSNLFNMLTGHSYVSDWTAITNYLAGESWQGTYYVKYGKITYLRISVKGLTANTNQKIATIPEFYRPVFLTEFAGFGGAAYLNMAHFRIDTDGGIFVYSADTYAAGFIAYPSY